MGTCPDDPGDAVFAAEARYEVPPVTPPFLVLTAVRKSTGPAADRRPVMPQTAWRWHG